MKNLISVMALVIATSSFAGMGPPPTGQPQFISAADAETIFGLLYKTGLATEYPQAETIQVKNLSCSLDTLEVIKGVPEQNAWSCSGDVGAKKLQVQYQDAMDLAAALSKYASETDGPAYRDVSVPYIDCNLDLLQAQFSCDL